MKDLKQMVNKNFGYPNIYECGCERGEDCTRTTMCHLQTAIEDSEECIEAMRKVIWDALTILQNEKYATRAYLAQQCLEDGLKEHGWPDYEGEE